MIFCMYSVLVVTWGSMTWAKGGPHPPQGPGHYRIDAGHSSIQFKAHHHDAGYTWGHFVRFSGSFETGKEGALESIEATARARSVDTDSFFRDMHLRSLNYIGVYRFPTISFTAQHIELLDTGHWSVSGPLELHGTSIPLTVEVSKTGEGIGPFGKERYGLETEFSVSLSDFGIVREGIGDELHIFVNLEGIKK